MVQPALPHKILRMGDERRAAVPSFVLFAAGSASGALQTIAWHPLDLLKTRMQVQDARVGRLPVYNSLTDAARTILRSESWRGFFHGLAPNVLGSALAWGLQMSLYAQLKRAASSVSDEQGRPNASRNLACSLTAGCLTNFVVHPIFLVKVRMQLQVRPAAGVVGTGVAGVPEAENAYRHGLHAAQSIVKEEGLRGLYRGFAPSMMLVSHGAILLMSYDQLRAVFPSVLAASFMAKVFSTIVTYPTQVLRAVMQQRPQPGTKHVPYRSVLVTTASLWRQGGVRAFYRGIFAQMLRTVPQSMAFFSIYEFTLKQMAAGYGLWSGIDYDIRQT
ncbi:mitochondrial carrier domain-containing protein [Pavlovales sp. CCMP2436]|nr:mitochondrial carrier domain-containing protein [Pavlovales sp. CCMP2436]